MSGPLGIVNTAMSERLKEYHSTTTVYHEYSPTTHDEP